MAQCTPNGEHLNTVFHFPSFAPSASSMSPRKNYKWIVQFLSLPLFLSHFETLLGSLSFYLVLLILFLILNFNPRTENSQQLNLLLYLLLYVLNWNSPFSIPYFAHFCKSMKNDFGALLQIFSSHF